MEPQKILVVSQDQNDRNLFEEAFQECVNQGVEVFFSSDANGAISLFHKERPQIVFLDETLMGPIDDLWVREGSRVIFISLKGAPKRKGEDFIYKPILKKQVIDKCRTAFCNITRPSPPPFM
ncbi:MAG: hypothetical protein ACKVOH_03865 [Chlamydiales bacterium]